MKYKFEVETDDREELETYFKADENSWKMFELRHNFHRKFKNLDDKGEEFMNGVYHVLDELRYLINEE